MPRLGPRSAHAVILGALGLALHLVSPGVVAQACTVDARPSAYADRQRDRLNTQVPTTAAQQADWSPFVFPGRYRVRRAISLTEDRREVARSLVPAALRRPWRWHFGDGRVADGWTVRHAYAHAGSWRILVAAYDPGTRQWYTFDQITIVVQR